MLESIARASTSDNANLERLELVFFVALSAQERLHLCDCRWSATQGDIAESRAKCGYLQDLGGGDSEGVFVEVTQPTIADVYLQCASMPMRSLGRVAVTLVHQ